MEEESKELVMKFEPSTIEHLGIKMYSQLPNAIAELVANAYDACATKVKIKLFDENEKKIIVEDNGMGMTFQEVDNKFLVIGRNRREEDGETAPCGRVVTGKKGLGKLAFFGIGKTIQVITKKNGKRVTFYLDWDDIKRSRGKYRPPYEIAECNKEETGTTIILSNLKRKTGFDAEELADSVSRLFNFVDTEFVIEIYLNNKGPVIVDRTLKYKNLETEFKWDFPKFSVDMDQEYEYKEDIRGKIVTTEKPLQPGIRGITLFANGRLVNLPSFFGAKESSHFYSYATGWLDVDFVDLWEEDVISTDRKSLRETEKTSALEEFLRACIYKIEREWRTKRKEKRTDEISKKTKIDIETWYEKLPSEIKDKVETIINPVIEDSELSEAKQSKVVGTIHNLIPEYPYYHWRHLHPEVQGASEKDYKEEDYYRAFLEAAKRYIIAVRNISGSNNKSDASMMGEVFGKNKQRLSVTKKYKKPDGSNFQATTTEDIEEGQKFLSMGIVSGCRNPVSHEEIQDLRVSGLFTEKDCLDALSLLSHLYRRLENAEKND